MVRDQITLLPQRREMLTSMSSPSALARAESVVVRESHLSLLRDLLNESLGFYDRVGAEEPWRGYLCVRKEDRAVVGCCGFKGNPKSGHVEISYLTFPDYEGGGYATAAARQLVRIASSAAEVESVIANTKPENNASTRVLERVGFERDGESQDDEIGRTWLWRIDLTGGSAS